MDFETKEAIHLASLTVANSFHNLYQDPRNNSNDVLEVLEAYKQVRRLLPKDEVGGKRYGASEAHAVMMGEA